MVIKITIKARTLTKTTILIKTLILIKIPIQTKIPTTDHLTATLIPTPIKDLLELITKEAIKELIKIWDKEYPKTKVVPLDLILAIYSETHLAKELILRAIHLLRGNEFENCCYEKERCLFWQ